jgi:hypothetical protein
MILIADILLFSFSFLLNFSTLYLCQSGCINKKIIIMKNNSTINTECEREREREREREKAHRIEREKIMECKQV